MKNAALLLFFLTAMTVSAQQSVLNGTVTVFNSQFETGKKLYVANAQVEEDYGKSQATTTNTEGVFKLPLVGIKDLEKVFFNVKKATYEVVNTDALQAVAGQKDTVQVYMALEGVIAENKRKYYQINRTASEKAVTEKLVQLGQQIETLQQNKEANRTEIETLQAEYGRLQESFKKIEETARELAERYAKTNLDDASSEYQRAFRYFQRGLLDSALFVFQKMDLEQTAQFVVSEQNRTASLKTEYETRNTEMNKQKVQTTEALLFKATLHETQFEFNQVDACYHLLLRLDSTNAEINFYYGLFLQKQFQYAHVERYYLTSLSFANSNETKAVLLNNLGMFYSKNQRIPEAEAAFNETLKINRQLAAKKPDVFLPYLAQILNNIGVFYRDNQKMPQAEAAYTEALDIRKYLVDVNPDVFLSDLAVTLNNIGVLYRITQKMPQAEAALTESLKIRRQLVVKKPVPQSAELSDVAQVLQNLGNYYSDVRNKAQSEAAYIESLNIYRTLADKNPNAFLPDVASTLNNLGVFYMSILEPSQADTAYTEALRYYRFLASKNQGTFLPDVAMTLNNIGAFYARVGMKTQAEAAYLEALAISRQLVYINPDVYSIDVAQTLNNLGVFYLNKSNFISALNHFEEAMSIQEAFILRGGVHQFDAWVTILQNISEVKDSLQTKKEYKSIAKATKIIAESCYQFKDLEARMYAKATYEYGNLSWWALFAKDYVGAEKAAHRCLELDKTQDYALTNLGHSQLLRGQYAAAKTTYEQSKGRKDNQGKDYKEVILDDFKTLEAEGITHKDMPRMKAEIEKW